MLEKEKAIDAVLIATPDHLHAYIAILAMKAGKHVYCEKPLTHNIREARLVARVAKETGVATQMGNQGRSSEGHRQTVEWLKDGAIGAVREVHAWSGKPRPPSAAGRARARRSSPPGLNWDLWLGPRAERPYSGKLAPFVWRWVWDFGNGTMPDMAPHHFDPAFNALGLDAPVTMEATASFVDPQVDYGQQPGHLPVRGEGGIGDRSRCSGTTTASGRRLRSASIRTTRSSGSARGQRPHARRREGDPHVRRLVRDAAPAPDGAAPRVQRPPKTLPRVAGHHADWLQACKGGTPACSNFEYGARLTEFVLLGTLALRTGKVVKWDAEGMRAANAPEAQPFIEGATAKRRRAGRDRTVPEGSRCRAGPRGARHPCPTGTSRPSEAPSTEAIVAS